MNILGNIFYERRQGMSVRPLHEDLSMSDEAPYLTKFPKENGYYSNHFSTYYDISIHRDNCQ